MTLMLVLGRERHEDVKIRKPHAQVNRKKGLGLRSDRLLDQFGVEAIRVRIDVDKNRNCIHQQHWPNRSFPGVGRNDDFIARTNIDGFKRSLDGHSSGVHDLSVFGGVELGEVFAESVAMFARKWLPAPIVIGQNIFERLPLFFGVNGPSIKALFSERLAASDRQFSHGMLSLADAFVNHVKRFRIRNQDHGTIATFMESGATDLCTAASTSRSGKR